MWRIAGVVALAGCRTPVGATTPSAAPPAVTPAHPRKVAFGLLPAGTRVRSHARADAPATSVAEPALVKVFPAEGPWVAVSDPGARHCAGEYGWPLADADVVLYAAASDLGLVTRHRVHHLFDDGTSVELAPGMPLTPAADGEYDVTVDRVSFRIKVAEADRGTTYAAPAPFDEPPERFRVPGDTDPHVAGKPVSADYSRGRRDGDRALIRISYRCAQLEAAVPLADWWKQEKDEQRASSAPDEVFDVIESEENRLGDMLEHGTTTVVAGRDASIFEDAMIEPGTGLFWFDGSPAGKARHEMWLGAGAGVERGTRLCFPRGEEPAADFLLCAERDEVRFVAPAQRFHTGEPQGPPGPSVDAPARRSVDGLELAGIELEAGRLYEFELLSAAQSHAEAIGRCGAKLSSDAPPPRMSPGSLKVTVGDGPTRVEVTFGYTEAVAAMRCLAASASMWQWPEPENGEPATFSVTFRLRRAT